MSHDDTSTIERPRIILIHGAANSALVWRFWQQELATLGWSSQTVNLRGHGAGPAADLSVTGMRDYADDVTGSRGDFRPSRSS